MNFFRSDSQPISFSQCWSFPHFPAYDAAESATGKASTDAALNADKAPANTMKAHGTSPLGESHERLDP